MVLYTKWKNFGRSRLSLIFETWLKLTKKNLWTLVSKIKTQILREFCKFCVFDKLQILKNGKILHFNPRTLRKQTFLK
jgi:hypothetical protein